MITLTSKDSLEGSNGVLKGNKLTWDTSENLGDLERLGEETLDLTGTLDGELVSLRQLIHTKNGNDILETLVGLEEKLNLHGNGVVLLTNDTWVHHAGLGVKWIDGWVDTQLRDTTGQDGGGIQMGEGGGWGWISQIISWHVDGLDGSNGSLGGGGNALLHKTHVNCESWLVSDGGWNTTEESGNLGTGLGETENVVNEEQHILSLNVTEVLSDGNTSKGDTGTGSRWLVHLTEDQGDLGFSLKVNDLGLLHLVVEIVTLTGTLTDTAENGETTVSLSNVVDKLLDENGLSDTGTSEKSNLTTTGVWGEKIDNLDTGDENLGGGRLLNERWGVGVNWGTQLGVDWATLINWVTGNVHDATKGLWADWNHDWVSGISGAVATDKSLSTIHGNAADDALSQVLL